MLSAEIKTLLDNPTHHSYLIIGSPDRNYENLRLALRKQVLDKKLEVSDVWSRQHEALNIDDAREIKEVQQTKPIGSRRVMLISLSSIQAEAQNSLLKLFEEPSSQTVFFVCAPHASIFLPTLLSRFYVIEEKSESSTGFESSDSKKLVSKFLVSTIQGRLTLLEPIIKDKDRIGAESFLNDLETEMHSHKNFAAWSSLFEDIFSARRFLRSRSPSVKMILEHLCGVVPFDVKSQNKIPA